VTGVSGSGRVLRLWYSFDPEIVLGGGTGVADGSLAGRGNQQSGDADGESDPAGTQEQCPSEAEALGNTHGQERNNENLTSFSGGQPETNFVLTTRPAIGNVSIGNLYVLGIYS